MLTSFFKKTGNQKWELDEPRPPPAMELIADSGAQVDIVGVAHISKIGLIKDQLLRTRVNLDCAKIDLWEIFIDRCTVQTTARSML